MKRRETKSGREDAARRAGAGRAGRTLTPDEDRLSGMMPDPKRLSAVCRSALAGTGSRWLSFTHGLSRGARRRLAVADTLAFVEALYGGKFRAVEAGASSPDRVYRTAGGGRFVSETRLSINVHPRFDLRLLNVSGGRAVSQVLNVSPTTLTLNLLSHAGLGEGRQPGAASHGTDGVVAAAPLTVHTWNVSKAGGERALPAFGYVSVRGRRAQLEEGFEAARPLARGERPLSGDVTTSPSAATPRPHDVFAHASLPLTSLDLRPPFTYEPRQEFVSVLLKTYLPAAASREVLSARTAGDLPFASTRRAAEQGGTRRRFEHGTPERQPPARTYAEPSQRRAPGGVVEVRREFHSTETLREHATERDARPPMLHLLPPASLLSSLSETSLTLLAGNTDAAGRATYHVSERAPALSLQHLRVHTTTPGTGEGTAAVHAPRQLDRTRGSLPSGSGEALSSLHTFVERVHSTVNSIRHAGSPTAFARPGFESVLRRSFGQVPARQRGGAGDATGSRTESPGLLVPTVEFIRHASAAKSARAASTPDANTQVKSERASGSSPTQGAPGSGAFLFASGLLRRSVGASAAGALSPTAATALRLAAAAETEKEARESREARAARPEGMALELIRHRREGVLNLPQPGYVFTQPARAQVEERQVITKASREEIVEVVRKEVRLLAADAPAQAAASRADLNGLAEEVYSTLVRRLLVEKERLGRI